MARAKKDKTTKKTAKSPSKNLKASKSAKDIKTVKLAKNKKVSKKSTGKKAINKKLQEEKKTPRFYDQLKLNESYVSLVLGSMVVVALSAIIFIYVMQLRGNTISENVLNSAVTPSPIPSQTTYVMQENESLWNVAVRFYGDGFSYTRIVEANPDVITNPDFVPPGTVIILPDLEN
jgi:nucleoid-associated protein YgaU